MKRLVLAAATSQAILWIRQIRYERRLSNRQGRWEREAERDLKQFGTECATGFRQTRETLEQWHGEIRRALGRPR